jgi:hypothetical protein
LSAGLRRVGCETMLATATNLNELPAAATAEASGRFAPGARLSAANPGNLSRRER